MFKNRSIDKAFLIFSLSSSLLTFSSCSPEVKIALWAKNHQDAAMALGVWAANNSAEATELLELDCKDHNQFKQKITDALNNAPEVQPSPQGYSPQQHTYRYGKTATIRTREVFADWCRKYPQAAKKLRSHAKAICNTGLGLLNGNVRIN